MSFEGSCHCGAVSFTVDADTPVKAISCNCSHCRRRGALLAFYSPEEFTLESGELVTTDRIDVGKPAPGKVVAPISVWVTPKA